MSHTPRMIEEVRAQIVEHGPWWLREPGEVTDALLWAIAGIFYETERQTGLLFDSTLIGLALGDWLLEHGREHGDLQIEGETDDVYRLRILGIQDQVTKPAILAAVQALLRYGTVVMEEATADGSFLVPEGDDTPKSLWLGLGTTIISAFAFRLLIPVQEAAIGHPGFLGVENDGWEDPREFLVLDDGGGPYPRPGLFMDAEGAAASGIYSQIARVVEQTRAAGVVARLEIVS